MKVHANGIQIEVEDSGQAPGENRPVVLLVMGLGMQLIAWPDNMVASLIEGGFRVVRHDNRDMGLSQDFDERGTGNLLWQGLRYRLGSTLASVKAAATGAGAGGLSRKKLRPPAAAA